MDYDKNNGQKRGGGGGGEGERCFQQVASADGMASTSLFIWRKLVS